MGSSQFMTRMVASARSDTSVSNTMEDSGSQWTKTGMVTNDAFRLRKANSHLDN